MNAGIIQAVRGSIPALKGRVYLNYGGAGTMPRSALDAVAAAFERQQAVGPFSAEGQLWAESEIAETKAVLASLLQVDADSILLTESVSAACSTILWGFDWNPGDEVIVTDCENPSILAAAMSVAQRFSLTIRELAVCGLGEEAILAGLEAVLCPRSRLLVVSHVSWIDGQILPLRAMMDLIHDCQPEMAILADGAQAVGCIDVRPNELDCDFYAFTGSKWICGPEGCAAMYIAPRWRDRIQPSHSGSRAVRWTGGNFEWQPGLRKLDAGTKPNALLAGLREAVRFHEALAPLAVRIGRMARLSNLARMQLGELAVSGGADGIVSFRVPFALEPSQACGLVHFLEARDVLIREIPGRKIWRICLHYFSAEDEILRFAALLSGYLDRARSDKRGEGIRENDCAVRFGYSEVAPLDWFQWRCLLWDHFPEASRADSAEAWDALAKRVNASSPGSSPHQANDYEQAFRAVRRVLPDATSGLEIWTRSLYEQVPRLLGRQPPFMNLGFMDEKASVLVLDAEDEPFRLNMQLYERALGGRRLRGQSVLECGCGGGGGVRYLAKYHDPAHVAGVDLLPWNIEACRVQNPGERWTFEVADASRLPFRGESFDAAIGIESSGHYDRPAEFFGEVTRILKPGGILYLADLRPVGLLWGEGRDLAALRSELQQAGLAILEESDLSDGVLSSIRMQESGRRQFLDALALDPASRAHFDEIMLMRGSRNFEFLANGDLRYVSLICEKPGKV